MKAAICTKYGPPEVLQITEIEKPEPKEKQILIKVKASAVTASDCIVRGLQMPFWWKIWMKTALGFNKPRKEIPGLTLAGEVEKTGKNAKRFKEGDRVFAFTGFGFGAYAEYKCMNEDSPGIGGNLELMPENMSFEEAAAIAYSGIFSTHYVDLGKIKRGDKVLIYGASGAIGATAVQLAKYYGAEVTGVCSTTNLALVKSLGADHTIDYTKKQVVGKNEKYDFVLDAVGKRKSSKLKVLYKTALTTKGKYISVDDGSPNMKNNYLQKIKNIIEQEYVKAVIDRTYPLEEIIEAHRYVDLGHKKGNVVIRVQ